MRDNSTSIAKAIGIILMVIGHAGCPNLLHNFIYQFHIPLFFFFSGYCFKEKHLSDFKTYAGRKITGIYFPFVKYALFFLILHNLFFHLDIYNANYGYNGVGSKLYSFKDYVSNAISITTSMSGEERLLGGFWFLKTLFLTSFAGYAFYKFIKKPGLQIAALLSIFAITVVISGSKDVSSFWNNVSLTLFATIFFVAGKTYSSLKQIHDFTQKWWFTILCFTITVTLSIVLPAGFTSPDWKIFYIIGSLSGIIMTRNISIYIQKLPKVSKFLIDIGDNTLHILTWHFLSFILISLAIVKIYGLPIQEIATFPVIFTYASKGWWIAYSIIGVVVPMCIVYLTRAIPQTVSKFNKAK